MAKKNQYYSLQGNVYMAKYDANGVLGSWFNVGSVSALSVAMEENVVEIKEYQTGDRAIAATIKNGLTASLNATLTELNEENINVLIRGSGQTIASSVVTDEVLDVSYAQYTAGTRDVLLDKVAASSIVVTDALAATVTGVGVDQAQFGVITLPEGLTASRFPLSVDYSAAGYVSTGLLTQEATPYAIKFNGVNTVTGGASTNMQVELYKISISPAKAIELLSADAKVMEVDLEAKVLVDLTKPESNDLGRYGNVKII